MNYNVSESQSRHSPGNFGKRPISVNLWTTRVVNNGILKEQIWMPLKWIVEISCFLTSTASLRWVNFKVRNSHPFGIGHLSSPLALLRTLALLEVVEKSSPAVKFVALGALNGLSAGCLLAGLPSNGRRIHQLLVRDKASERVMTECEVNKFVKSGRVVVFAT